MSVNRYRISVLTIVIALSFGLAQRSVALPGLVARAGGSGAASEVGVTPDQIRIGVVADVDSPLAPGVFKRSVDAVQAWAKLVNQQGGLAGRKVIVDFIDSKLDASETRNAIIKACANDFAIVGTSALFLNNVDDLVGCPDASGKATGLPDLPALALESAQKCSPVSFPITDTVLDCATFKPGAPETYRTYVGDIEFLKSKYKDLHGINLLTAGLKSTRDTSLVDATGFFKAGVKKDGAGTYDGSLNAPQSFYTPMVKVLKDNGSTFISPALPVEEYAKVKREAKFQGVNTVKVWHCRSTCYDPKFLQTAGADADGTYVTISYLPYEDQKQSPELRTFLKAVGGQKNTDGYGILSWVASRAFEDAVNATVKANGKNGLTRANFLAQMKQLKNFTANGLIGPKDVGAKTPSGCGVVLQVQSGKFVRVDPTKPGTFDCGVKSNSIASYQMDLLP